MDRVQKILAAFLGTLWLAGGPALSCVALGFAGDQPLAAWDDRDHLARQIEADGAAVGLPAAQVTRLAWALRLGLAAAPALTTADLAALRAFDTACADPVDPTDGKVEASFGFDIRQGWRQLAASGAFSALALTGLVIAARLHAIRRRRRKRYFCSIAVQCRDAQGATHLCRVEDVSMSGARLSLRGAAPLTTGSDVELDFGGVSLQGHVAWANRHFTGVDFARMLTRAELLHLVRPEKYPQPPPESQGGTALGPTSDAVP